MFSAFSHNEILKYLLYSYTSRISGKNLVPEIYLVCQNALNQSDCRISKSK